MLIGGAPKQRMRNSGRADDRRHPGRRYFRPDSMSAMRTSLLAYRKNQPAAAGRPPHDGTCNRALARQIGGVMLVMGFCSSLRGVRRDRVPVFNGDPQSVRFVSSYSLAEGARGYPRLVEYQVAPDPNGGVRLLMNERIYCGPASSVPLCVNRTFLPSSSRRNPSKWRKARLLPDWCTREPTPYSPVGGAWLPVWNQPNLPRVVRIEMASLDPNPARLPVTDSECAGARHARGGCHLTPINRNFDVGQAIVSLCRLALSGGRGKQAVTASAAAPSSRFCGCRPRSPPSRFPFPPPSVRKWIGVATDSDGLRTYYLASGSIERGIQWVMWGGGYRNPDGSPALLGAESAPHVDALPQRRRHRRSRFRNPSKLNINTASD